MLKTCKGDDPNGGTCRLHSKPFVHGNILQSAHIQVPVHGKTARNLIFDAENLSNGNGDKSVVFDGIGQVEVSEIMGISIERVEACR
jgi:hypothetical protein